MKWRVALFSVLLSFLLAIPAYATPTNCSPSTAWEHHYVGGRYNTIAWGVAVNIETQNVDICPNSGVSQWVTSYGGTGNWVQTGHRQLAGWSSPLIYTEASSATTGYYSINNWNSPSGTMTYKIDYDGYWWNMYANGVRQWSIEWALLRWNPSQMQVFAELHDSGDQVPGRISNPVSWGYPQVKTSQSGSYSMIALSKYPIDSTIVGHTGTNMADPDSFWETWDTRYQ